MNVLFVCKYNIFRSKVAEAFFLYYNKANNINVKSAGMLKYSENALMNKSVKDILEGRKIKYNNVGSRLIDKKLIEWADKIIIVADNVLPEQFPPEKVIHWKIPDASEHNSAAILQSMNQIEKEVKNLVKRMEYLKK